ncbi:conserved hypothetical protein [Culex quinquefasciatus]|uniref:Integrase catalytic domain-containing protein n=1 Tax=Culex quinquefasciatus TaxID=7176 RepID=B0WL89_CULQU|nr:conserved hypothetical protein [Culex quinquefasciatus]|eukprot:XP_001849473.1 conserved hypothetical protein [Culex quinquefasciatus]
MSAHVTSRPAHRIRQWRRESVEFVGVVAVYEGGRHLTCNSGTHVQLKEEPPSGMSDSLARLPYLGQLHPRQEQFQQTSLRQGPLSHQQLLPNHDLMIQMLTIFEQLVGTVQQTAQQQMEFMERFSTDAVQPPSNPAQNVDTLPGNTKAFQTDSVRSHAVVINEPSVQQWRRCARVNFGGTPIRLPLDAASGGPILSSPSVCVNTASGTGLSLDDEFRCDITTAGSTRNEPTIVTELHVSSFPDPSPVPESVLHKVFNEELGKEVNLELKENRRPTVCPKRPVAYAVVENVDHELDTQQQQQLNIITPIVYSKLAAPIVGMRKAIGSKPVLNATLQPRLYPLLVENAHGAYQQSIATSLAREPGAFYHLKGADVDGATQKEHDRNLQAVLQHFQDYGPTVRPDRTRFELYLLLYDFASQYVSTDKFGHIDVPQPIKRRVRPEEDFVIARIRLEDISTQPDLLLRRYVFEGWPTKAADPKIQRYQTRADFDDGEACQLCASVARSPPYSLPVPSPKPAGPWQRSCMDIAEPLNDDYVVRTHRISVLATIAILHQMFPQLGKPNLIVDDNRTQFTSVEIFSNGVHHTATVPYQPHGRAKRVVGILKRAVKTISEGRGTIGRTLDIFLSAYRCAPEVLDPKPHQKEFDRRGIAMRENNQRVTRSHINQPRSRFKAGPAASPSTKPKALPLDVLLGEWKLASFPELPPLSPMQLTPRPPTSLPAIPAEPKTRATCTRSGSLLLQEPCATPSPFPASSSSTSSSQLALFSGAPTALARAGQLF